MNLCRIRVRGLVQGVGFRPYVWRLARELELSGWVRNDGAGVEIEARGGASALAALLNRLPREAPRLARVDAVEPAADFTRFLSRQAAGEPHGYWIYEALPVPVGNADPDVAAAGEADFAILESAAGSITTAIGPDAALCLDCIADLCDPQGRRWRYAFTTCTHCGPRHTVSRGIPYDRARTSLAAFPLCPPCAAEYADPADRRFHAETTACPECGPRLALLDATGEALPGEPIAEALHLLRAGKIVALKGLGGFHLACDARNPGAVATLRARKIREEKPFAVMGLNPASLAAFARIGAAEAALLARPEAPIVLCPKGEKELPGLAPGLAWLGTMLPATPLHLLLWHEAAGRPAGSEWLVPAHPLLLVMTSANPHGEPLVIGNDEALSRLTGIADAFLLHDRDIVVRCDDSVLAAETRMDKRSTGDPRFIGRFIRRARGYTPVPIPLAEDGPAVLAFGGYLKNTICVLKGREAFLSQHIGGLDNAAAIGFLEESVSHLLAILDIEPQIVAHDLHPDFPSSRLAAAFAAERGIPALAIGHHHAHIAAILAEHGVAEPVLGLALDGVGLGPDGGAWGGELLQVEGARCERLGHLAPLKLPGGDRAAREPWRLAASALVACGRRDEIPLFIARRHPGRDGALLARLLEKDFNCPPTSSLGRLFDAAAGLLGLRSESRYEGQAAMELEGLAARHGPVSALSGGYARLGEKGGVLDFSPLLSALADCENAPFGAALFHATVAEGLAAWAARAAAASGFKTLACGGGCAMNAVLMAALRHHLTEQGVQLLEARQAPPNDGGLALGQGWVARAYLAQ